MGTVAGDRVFFWRTENLRFAPFHHVFAAGMLLLREAKESVSGNLVLSRQEIEGSSCAQRRGYIESESSSPFAYQTPRRGGIPNYRLAQRSLRCFRRVERETPKETRQEKEISESALTTF